MSTSPTPADPNAHTPLLIATPPAPSKLGLLLTSRKFWAFIAALVAVVGYEAHILDAVATAGIITSCISYLLGTAIEDAGYHIGQGN